MSRNTKPWALALLAVSAAFFAMGQGTSPPAPARVASVNVQAVLNGMDEFAALTEKQRARFEKLDAQVKEAADRLKAMAADIDAMMPDDPDRPDRVIAFRKLEASTKTESDMNRSLKTLERGEMVIALYKKVVAATTLIAERDKYDLVLHNDASIPLPKSEISDGDAGQVIMQRKVLYAASGLDITGQVLERINNDFKAGKK